MRTFTRTVLVADEGKVLTNGKTYGTAVYLAEGADASLWREVSANECVCAEVDAF